MDDLVANRIVFMIFLFTLFGIMYILGLIFRETLLNTIVTKLKNNSGNYSSVKILMLIAFFVLLGMLLLWLFRTNTFIRASLSRSPELKDSE
jgi:glucan phosphoethanolaminetransferase (alkaline phosphatase superfamily)